MFLANYRSVALLGRWSIRHWLANLMCATLLVASVDGTHLHLCLDGQDSARTLRMGPDISSQAGIGAPHNDVDLALASDLFAKPGKGELKPPPALPGAPLSVLVDATQSDAPTGHVAVFRTSSPLLLPPPRGPPAITTV